MPYTHRHWNSFLVLLSFYDFCLSCLGSKLLSSKHLHGSWLTVGVGQKHWEGSKSGGK